MGLRRPIDDEAAYQKVGKYFFTYLSWTPISACSIGTAAYYGLVGEGDRIGQLSYPCSHDSVLGQEVPNEGCKPYAPFPGSRPIGHNRTYFGVGTKRLAL